MLAITPGWTPPTVPDLDFLDVQAGVRPSWTRAAVVGGLIGILAATAVIVAFSRRSERS